MYAAYHRRNYRAPQKLLLRLPKGLTWHVTHIWNRTLPICFLTREKYAMAFGPLSLEAAST